MEQLKQVLNVNIAGSDPLITPEQMQKQVPVSERALQTVVVNRQIIQNILDGRDDRLFFVVGPCSIHDLKAAVEYAERLKKLSDQVNDQIVLVMRVYFEKPRTTVGWKGLINDPRMDDSFHIEEGLKIARQLLIQINEMGLPCGTEALDPISPQYFAELVTWAAIGARTTESQTHRELSSGLSMPVGFKNGTDGSIEVAINAMMSVLSPHHFLGINEEGRVSKFSTRGNPYGHVVLRGGDAKPNYDSVSISGCIEKLVENGLRRKLVIDCSHANSGKDHKKQPLVLADVTQQVVRGNRDIVGVMIESHLNEGNQKIPQDLKTLQYGVSVTDKCVGWDMTEKMILDAYEQLNVRAR